MESPMRCQEFLVRHTDYLDGLLGSEESRRYEDHIVECASCARYDRVIRQGVEILRAAPAIEPSPDFFPRLQHRLYHVEDELRTGSRGPGANAVVSLAIAGVLALLAWSPLLRLDHLLVPGNGEVVDLAEEQVDDSSRDSLPSDYGADHGEGYQLSPNLPRGATFGGATVRRGSIREPATLDPIRFQGPEWFGPRLSSHRGHFNSLVNDEIFHPIQPGPREWSRDELGPLSPWSTPHLSLPAYQLGSEGIDLREGDHSGIRPVNDTLRPRR